MRYLRAPGARGKLLLFVASSALFVCFPAIDLHVSSWFYRNGSFYLARRWWIELLHWSVGSFLSLGLAAVVALWLFNCLAKRNVGGVTGRVVVYLLLVLALAEGLVINVVLKNGFGRARPRNITEFGGPQIFTPAFVVTDECASNCSFSSGDGAGAFFWLSAVLVGGRKRLPLLAAFTFGTVVSVSRIAAGAHYLSDSFVSFFLMWIAADVLHFYLFRPWREALPDAVSKRREALAVAGAGGFEPFPAAISPDAGE